MASGRDALRAIVVGTGFGCRIHVPALRAAGFDVAALVGRDAAKLARRAEATGVPRHFTDLDAAIAATGAGTVTIATPPQSHAALALTAIRNGCHVLCEKPLAMDADEAQAMLDAANAAGIVHVTGNEFRWAPERALLGRVAADGTIGTPRLLTLTQCLPFVAAPDAKLPGWWFDAGSGGGWLGASGSHIVDQIIAWLDDFASLSAALPIVSDRSDVAEDTYVVHFTMKNGLDGILQHSAGVWGPMESTWRLAGTKGTVWIEGDRVKLADAAGVRAVDVPADLRLPEPPEAADPTSSRRYSHLELGPFTRLCEAFRARIEGRPVDGAVALPTFATGLATMRVLDAIRTSAARGGERIVLD